MNANPLKTSFDRARRASEQRSIVRGLIGRKSTDTAAQCVVTNRPDFLYVRVGAPDSYTVGIARSSGGIVVRANTPVRMVHGDDGNLQILGYDTSSPAFYVVTGGDTSHPSGVPPHTHAMNSGMTYEIESLRLEPGRISSTSGMIATVNGFRHYAGTFAGGDVDLTSYVPTSGLHGWVLVGLNPTSNTIVTAASTPITTATLLQLADLDTITFAGYIPLGAFQVSFGDTSLGAAYEAREWLNIPANVFDDAEGDPAPVVTTTAADGTSSNAARRDHVHGITNDAVTFAKMQNVPTDSLLGRDTASTGDPESITLGAGLQFSGAGVLQRAALFGDVATATDGNATVIVAGAVTTTKILNDAVTNAKLDNMPTKTYKGRTTAATGDPEDVAVATVAADINASLDHGALIGLADDDHPQYSLVTGVRAFSGGITAPAFDLPLLDATYGDSFIASLSYPTGWTQVTAAYISGAGSGVWHLAGNTANPAWKYKRVGPYNIEGLSVFKSFIFGPITITDIRSADDITYYFGVYRNNAGAIDDNTYARIALNWDTGTSKWRCRLEGKDGTTTTNGTWVVFPYPPLIQPLWLRVALDANPVAYGYVGNLQLPGSNYLMDQVNLAPSSAWGAAFLQVHMSRGATDAPDHLYIGGIDFGDYQ